MDSEVFSTLGGQSDQMTATGGRLVVLPEVSGRKKSWLWALIRLVGAILRAVLRGLRAVWASSVRAAQEHNRQMEVLDHRYRSSYYIR